MLFSELKIAIALTVGLVAVSPCLAIDDAIAKPVTAIDRTWISIDKPRIDRRASGIIAEKNDTGVQDSIEGTLDQLRSLQAPAWMKPLPGGNCGFCRAVEAISGKPPADDLKQFLNGVVKIERSGPGVRLYREDSEMLDIQPGTEFGDRLLAGIDHASQKATRKFGKPVGELIAGLSGVTLEGNKISVQRNGSQIVPVVLQKQKQEKRYWVKELKLDEMSFEVYDRNGRPAIKNVSGLVAVLDALSLPIELREFSQSLNKQGLKVYAIGIKNPLPRTVTSLLGLGEVLHLHFAEHPQGKHKTVDTQDNELDEAQRAAGTTVTSRTAPIGHASEKDSDSNSIDMVPMPDAGSDNSTAAPNSATTPAVGAQAPNSVTTTGVEAAPNSVTTPGVEAPAPN